MRNKLIFLFTFLFFAFLTAFSLHIPFFWDGIFFSESAVHFFENGSDNFITPIQVDTGGFPLYPIYLSVVWKVLGKTLLVSHLAMFPFLIGIAYEYYKLAKRFLKESMLPFAMVLLVVEPTFITQSILMGYDILMVYFFLVALNSLLRKNQLLYSLALTLLCLSSMRGIMLGISLFIMDIILNSVFEKKINVKIFSYVSALVAVLFWAFYHHQKTGWFFFSPERENNHEALVSASMMFRQFIFIVWKISDLGRIVLWIVFIFGGYYFYKKQKENEFKKIIIIVFIPLITLICFMVPLSNPIGHKYFIITFLGLNIAVCYLLQQVKTKKLQIGFLLFFCVMMVSGNLWIYPQRYGNAWDSSLKILPYFELQKKMDDYIRNEKISEKEIGTQFPLIADNRYTYLENTSYKYSDWQKDSSINFKYMLLSNVINTDSPEQFKKIKAEWKLIKELKSGQLSISLYENPHFNL